MNSIRRLLSNYRYAAIALVTVLTLGIAGAVILTTTSLGCGPANKLGVKTTRCLQAGAVANVGSPTPQGKGLFTPPTGQPSSPPPPPENSPSASQNPPSPGSDANVPYNPGASSAPPYQNLASSGAPPLAYPASGSPGGVFSCRLPVYAGGPGSGGFIVYPDQTFVADPRSAVTAPTPNPPPPSPSPVPGYGRGYPQGWYGETYDAHYAKWLPVPYAWVSPDGAHYAYPLGGDIYAQNVAGGSLLELDQGRGFNPIDTENDGVYVITPNQSGLWFLPFSGSPKQITSSGFWQAVSGGAAYGAPTSAVPAGASNTIERLDLKTGATQPFFSEPGGQSQVTGFDPLGNPVIQVQYRNAQATFIATGPNTSVAIATMIYGQNYYPGPPPYPSGSPVADSHGLWFSVGNGIVLYRNLGWYWMSSIGGQLAGQCV